MLHCYIVFYTVTSYFALFHRILHCYIVFYTVILHCYIVFNGMMCVNIFSLDEHVYCIKTNEYTIDGLYM